MEQELIQGVLDINCDGTCSITGKCKGEIRKVHVFSEIKDWGEFYYCDTAIETDRSRGFTVEEKEEKNDET